MQMLDRRVSPAAGVAVLFVDRRESRMHILVRILVRRVSPAAGVACLLLTRPVAVSPST